MTTAIFSHPDCKRHDMGDWHPECPARLQAIDDQLIASGLANLLDFRDAPLASVEALSLVGLTAELAGGFVVYLPRVLRSSQLTTLESLPIPHHAVYGRILEPLTLRAERGDEGSNASYTLGGLTIEEEP